MVRDFDTATVLRQQAAVLTAWRKLLARIGAGPGNGNPPVHSADNG
jgi:hypothetical protein